jgi:hypothetical protein
MITWKDCSCVSADCKWWTTQTAVQTHSNYMFIVLNWSLKHLYHSLVCVLLTASSPDASFNNLKVPENFFPNLKQKISNTLLMRYPFLISEKFAQQARHVFTLIDTAQWLDKLEGSGWWHSPKEAHCNAAQQRNLAPPSCSCANSTGVTLQISYLSSGSQVVQFIQTDIQTWMKCVTVKHYMEAYGF